MTTTDPAPPSALSDRELDIALARLQGWQINDAKLEILLAHDYPLAATDPTGEPAYIPHYSTDHAAAAQAVAFVMKEAKKHQLEARFDTEVEPCGASCLVRLYTDEGTPSYWREMWRARVDITIADDEDEWNPQTEPRAKAEAALSAMRAIAPKPTRKSSKKISTNTASDSPSRGSNKSYILTAAASLPCSVQS